MILTTETVQSIVDDNNERFIQQGEKELLDDFKDKRRYNLTILDIKDSKKYKGLVVVDKKDETQNKILSVKEFKEVIQ